MTDVAALLDRLAAARAGLAELDGPIRAGAPWPLATHFGTEPESAWYPPEVLAHLAEMFPFWRGELERVLASPADPTPFGRIADDALRIGVIGRDRTLPVGELLRRTQAGAADWQVRLGALTPDDLARRGVHPTRGELTPLELAERFVVGHLEEHVEQLRALLADQVFVLYAVVVGVLVGLATGGRLERLGAARIRWAPLALLGLAVQIALFADPIARSVGDLGPPIYVGSTAAVLAVVLANLRLPGAPLIALGASANLLAILANGGYMPADPGALAAAGETLGDGYSNSIVLADPALRPLTDIFAIPASLPLANVFSIGDVLIAIGLAWAIAAALRGDPEAG